MSTCLNEELCCAFVDDEVSPVLKEKLETHLLECERCRFLANKYKFIKLALVQDADLDLNQSFSKLIARRDGLRKRRYLIFPIKTKYKIIASSVASMFLFAFLFVFLTHNSIYDKVFILSKGKVEFTPIVPVPHRQHSNVITNIDLRDMTSVIKSKKRNKKIYKDFTNTFNSFSSLYTSLENNTNDFAITIPDMSEKIPYNYGMSMPIYANLKKDVK